jgi:hypothetical protein
MYYFFWCCYWLKHGWGVYPTCAVFVAVVGRGLGASGVEGSPPCRTLSPHGCCLACSHFFLNAVCPGERGGVVHQGWPAWRHGCDSAASGVSGRHYGGLLGGCAPGRYAQTRLPPPPPPPPVTTSTTPSSVTVPCVRLSVYPWAHVSCGCPRRDAGVLLVSQAHVTAARVVSRAPSVLVVFLATHVVLSQVGFWLWAVGCVCW